MPTETSDTEAAIRRLLETNPGGMSAFAIRVAIDAQGIPTREVHNAIRNGLDRGLWSVQRMRQESM